MERSNQPPKPECCRREGQANAAQEGGGAERLVGGVHRENHEPQAGVAPRLSNPASKSLAAGEDAFLLAELNTAGAAMGKATADLPPKSSPKRIAAKEARDSPPPRLSFSARLLRIHALSVKKHHNLLIGRHLPTPAFYSAVFQSALAGAL